MRLQHSDYMELALREAETALALGETPVGCVVVSQSGSVEAQIVGYGHNTRETEHTALGHAELNAIARACEALGSWRLEDCTLYVTLEPCPMCMGAILNARIGRVIFGAYDSKAGCAGSLADFTAMGFNHRPEVMGGIRELACGGMLTRFFEELREKAEK